MLIRTVPDSPPRQASGDDRGRARGAPGVTPGTGPIVLRMLLGTHLRRLREAAEVSREVAGDHIRASESKISRMELGRVGLKLRDVADLLTLYGMGGGEERESLLRLARQASVAGWWKKYGDVLPPWFESYVGMEEAATRLRTYELQFVPGLLQTEAYARAVIASQPGLPASEIERRVKLRMERQRVLSRPNPPRLWTVLDEAVLHRLVGSPAVMRAQLERLLEATRQPHIVVQVIPFGYGGHAAEGGGFTILRFPQPELPDVVYIEQLTTALYLDKPEEVERYTAVMDHLVVQAAPPTASGLIEDVLQKL